MQGTLTPLTVGPQFGMHSFGRCGKRELKRKGQLGTHSRAGYSSPAYMLLVHLWRPTFRSTILAYGGV